MITTAGYILFFITVEVGHSIQNVHKINEQFLKRITTLNFKLNEILNLLAILFVKVTLEFATVTQAVDI